MCGIIWYSRYRFWIIPTTLCVQPWMRDRMYKKFAHNKFKIGVFDVLNDKEDVDGKARASIQRYKEQMKTWENPFMGGLGKVHTLRYGVDLAKQPPLSGTFYLAVLIHILLSPFNMLFLLVLNIIRLGFVAEADNTDKTAFYEWAKAKSEEKLKAGKSKR